jgi:pseudouridylate synthase
MSELKISPELLQISPEVQDALKNKKPVVALESTIISHGMHRTGTLKKGRK